MTETHGVWHLLLGNLTYDARPFYSAIAAFAAGLVVVGAISVFVLITWLG